MGALGELHSQDFSEIATRLRQVLARASFTQRELAERLGMSPSYVSELVRGLKRPGTEFFIEIRRVLGVSIDWLLTGEGAMFGSSGIRSDEYQAVRLQVAAARAAVIDNDPVAGSLVDFLLADRQDEVRARADFRQLLERLVPAESDFGLTITLYNSHTGGSDPVAQRQRLVASAVAHFQAQQSSNAVDAIWGRPAGAFRTSSKAGGRSTKRSAHSGG